MPNTITTFHTFAPKTPAQSSEVNTNFSNFRGDRIPIEPNTEAASDLTHDLGSEEHRWRGVYSDYIDLEPSTGTASSVIRSDKSVTAGAINFEVASAVAARIVSDGFDGAYISKNSPINTSTSFTPGLLKVPMVQEFTANGSFTLPADVTQVRIQMQGGGGGGGGGGGAGSSQDSGGGGGGSSGRYVDTYITGLTPGEVLSITVGSGGGGGANGSGGSSPGSAGSSGNNTFVANSVFTPTAGGGGGGGGGVGSPGTAGGAGGNPGNQLGSDYAAGGAGGGSSSNGSAGQGSVVYAGASPGTTSGLGGGGGGGGSGFFGQGGSGGNFSGGVSQNGNAASANTGGGGGGGSGTNGNTDISGGTGGSGGSGRVKIIYLTGY